MLILFLYNFKQIWLINFRYSTSGIKFLESLFLVVGFACWSCTSYIFNMSHHFGTVPWPNQGKYFLIIWNTFIRLNTIIKKGCPPHHPLGCSTIPPVWIFALPQTPVDTLSINMSHPQPTHTIYSLEL